MILSNDQFLYAHITSHECHACARLYGLSRPVRSAWKVKKIQNKKSKDYQLKFQGRSPKFNHYSRISSFSKSFRGEPKIEGVFKDCGISVENMEYPFKILLETAYNYTLGRSMIINTLMVYFLENNNDKYEAIEKVTHLFITHSKTMPLYNFF